MNSLEFIKQHVTKWPYEQWCTTHLREDGMVLFNDYPKLDLSEHFAPDYHDGKVWTREEFESVGVGGLPSWDIAPEWATSLGTVGGVDGVVWYNDRTYQYVDRSHGEYIYSFGKGDNYKFHDVKHISDWVRAKATVTPAPSFDNVTHSKYEREITDRQGNSATVDAYDVIIAFGVTCPATQDAIKELLYDGDLSEARDSITRAIELLG